MYDRLRNTLHGHQRCMVYGVLEQQSHVRTGKKRLVAPNLRNSARTRRNVLEKMYARRIVYKWSQKDAWKGELYIMHVRSNVYNVWKGNVHKVNKEKQWEWNKPLYDPKTKERGKLGWGGG